jgi:hypothetical protein
MRSTDEPTRRRSSIRKNSAADASQRLSTGTRNETVRKLAQKATVVAEGHLAMRPPGRR